MRHQLRARYIDLWIDDDDQRPEDLAAGIVQVRTKDDELLPFDKDVLQATYLPVQATTADMAGALG